MAMVTKQNVIVLTLSELEASAVNGVLRRIGGHPGKLGRRETESIVTALQEAGVGSLDVWDGEMVSTST